MTPALSNHFFGGQLPAFISQLQMYLIKFYSQVPTAELQQLDRTWVLSIYRIQPCQCHIPILTHCKT